jgi:hypothetical protein
MDKGAFMSGVSTLEGVPALHNHAIELPGTSTAINSRPELRLLDHVRHHDAPGRAEIAWPTVASFPPS